MSSTENSGQSEQDAGALSAHADEQETISADTVVIGTVIGLYSAVVTAVVVVSVSRGLWQLPLMSPWGFVIAVVVNVGVVAGVMPAMQVWRRTPVVRWLVWGSWAGACVGWGAIVSWGMM